MSYCFDVSNVFSEDDGYMVMIGFADHISEPSQFVLLQKAKEYDEQDKRLGMDKIHIQVEDESRSIYGGITSISKDGDKLTIALTEDAKSALQIEGNIEMQLDSSLSQLTAVLTELGELAGNEGIAFIQNA